MTAGPSAVEIWGDSPWRPASRGVISGDNVRPRDCTLLKGKLGIPELRLGRADGRLAKLANLFRPGGGASKTDTGDGLTMVPEAWKRLMMRALALSASGMRDKGSLASEMKME